jgi:hypothetical protein
MDSFPNQWRAEILYRRLSMCLPLFPLLSCSALAKLTFSVFSFEMHVMVGQKSRFEEPHSLQQAQSCFLQSGDNISRLGNGGQDELEMG